MLLSVILPKTSNKGATAEQRVNMPGAVAAISTCICAGKYYLDILTLTGHLCCACKYGTHQTAWNQHSRSVTCVVWKTHQSKSIAWRIQDVSHHSHMFKRGSTPLHVAAEQGDVSIMNALLAHQADLTITDAEVSCCQHVEVWECCMDQLQDFSAQHAKQSMELMEPCSQAGRISHSKSVSQSVSMYCPEIAQVYCAVCSVVIRKLITMAEGCAQS